MRPETVMIDTDNGPVMINKSDYDPNSHKLANAADSATLDNGGQPAGLAPAAPLAVDANGNPVNAGDGGQFVPAPQSGAPAVTEPTPEPQPQQTTPPTGEPEKLLVTKNGKKFVVVNGEGEPVEREGIDADGYKSEAEAWNAVMALNTPKTA